MHIIYKLSESFRVKNVCLTIGTFDGIHLGHQKIIEEVIKKSKEIDGKSVLLTFDQHPQNVLNQDTPRIRVITTKQEKLEILNQYSLDYMVILNFNQKLGQMTADDFLDQQLLPYFKLSHLLIGYNHAIGNQRIGTPEYLKKLGEYYGFVVDRIKPVIVEDQLVSSTFIRKLILAGQVDKAQHYLGRYYKITGCVQAGRQLGSKFGFPTANLKVHDQDKLIPGDGGYAVWVTVGKQRFAGMANIGFSPTVGGTKRNIEIHLHNFSDDLYQQHLDIEFVHRIRDEKSFDTVEGLIEQLKKDKNITEKILLEQSRR